MVNLAPGVPIPLPPQDNPNLQSFGKGVAAGLEKYIDKRMKQKERAEILQEALDEYSKKKAIDAYKEVLDQTLTLDLMTKQNPQTPMRMPEAPTQNIGSAESLMPSLMPQGDIPATESVPTLPPSLENKDQMVRENIMTQLGQGVLPKGYGETYQLNKTPKEYAPSKTHTPITPTNDNIDLLKKHISFMNPEIGKTIQVPNTLLAKLMGGTQYANRLADMEYTDVSRKVAESKMAYDDLFNKRSNGDMTITPDQINAAKLTWDHYREKSGEVLKGKHGTPEFEGILTEIVDQDAENWIREKLGKKLKTTTKTYPINSPEGRAVSKLQGIGITGMTEGDIKATVQLMQDGQVVSEANIKYVKTKLGIK